MSEFRSDISVVGGGVAGLWTAKELIERGHSVNVIEKSGSLATGATTRNEGWLHAGTYHSVAIQDETDAVNVTARTVYGHDAIADFVPESVEHDPTYAFFNSEELAHEALVKWARHGIYHREIPVGRFAEEGFDTSRIRAAFEVRDKSVNSRIICQKLAHFIIENGGKIFTGATFSPTGETAADLLIDEELHKLHADAFVIAAGAGSKQIFDGISDTPFPMRYLKSHLLVTPRLTKDNYFYMDSREAGIMSHGNSSIIGINKEAVELPAPDYDVIPATKRVLYDALGRMLPRVRQYGIDTTNITGVACVKVDVTDNVTKKDTGSEIIVQDLNIKVFEPVNNYICALPGKMTEAPALARAAADYIEGHGSAIGKTPSQQGELLDGISVPHVNYRPADNWMREQSRDKSSFEPSA